MTKACTGHWCIGQPCFQQSNFIPSTKGWDTVFCAREWTLTCGWADIRLPSLLIKPLLVIFVPMKD